MKENRSAHVIVLGDVACSPRTVSHARELSSNGWKVKLSGYGNLSELKTFKGIKFCPVNEPPNWTKSFQPRFVGLIFKYILTAIYLAIHLIMRCNADVIFLQNPPSLPTFFVIWIYAKLRNISVIIDWHNYGYTIMELNTKRGSILSRIYYLFEIVFAKTFFGNNSNTNKYTHICVSKAMQTDMKKRMKLNAHIVYDKPSTEFKFTNANEAHKLFTRLSKTYPELADPAKSIRRTRFTEMTTLSNNGDYTRWRRDRPALVVSSCSWTPDDDFSIMLQALDKYNKKATLDNKLPTLVCIVTGRGPLKDFYANEVKERRWQNVEVILPWLDWADYPILLGSADLGVSLHRSSSDLDLPMKVVDMFGCGVPTLGLAYPALSELLVDGCSGRHFVDATSLALLLCNLLRSSQLESEPNDQLFQPEGANTEEQDKCLIGSRELAAYRRYVYNWAAKPDNRWPQYWAKTVLPLLSK